GVAWAPEAGQFVAVGNSGAVYTSPDGVTWTSRVSGVNTPLYGVAWTGSMFVAVTTQGKVITSSDGIEWSARTTASGATLYAIARAGSQLVAVGASGTVQTSTVASPPGVPVLVGPAP